MAKNHGGSRVTVHCVVNQDSHIIPLMASWLEPLGWTVGGAPRNDATVNYFMSYLQFANHPRPSTKTAAWFTHFEDYNEGKIRAWEYAAICINQPIITSRHYCDVAPGVKKVTPGIDRDTFRPLKRREMGEVPIIGIVGMGQPRKGPKLIIDLIYSDIKTAVVITGKHWPFTRYNVWIEHDKMPEFYNDIDIFLCTSTIEGIPMPVLEALACDKKTVVPWGVGICDELPEMEGLRHYEKGNGQDMLRAIRQVMDDKPSEGALRDVTDAYTLQHWRESHQEALNGLL